MKTSLIATLAALALATPALAAGDAAKGEKEFNKCKSCHEIVKPDGTVVVKGGKVGPNLFGVVGMKVADVPGFAFGDSIKAVGEKGVVWDEAMIAEYVKDPGAWLKAQTGDAAAKSKMTFKLAKGGEDVAAYLASVAK